MSRQSFTTPSPQAVRLFFTYDATGVRLESQQLVDALIPGTDTPREEIPGHFVEVRDARGQRLAQVPIRGAFRTTIEVFPERKGDPITVVKVPQPAGAFTVLVPVSPDAARYVVVNRQPPRSLPSRLGAPEAFARGQATELGTFAVEVAR
ncbi:MAG: hypothetical protein ACRDPR_01990 [Nocardioidaceae bacterium]